MDTKDHVLVSVHSIGGSYRHDWTPSTKRLMFWRTYVCHSETRWTCSHENNMISNSALPQCCQTAFWNEVGRKESFKDTRNCEVTTAHLLHHAHVASSWLIPWIYFGLFCFPECKQSKASDVSRCPPVTSTWFGEHDTPPPLSVEHRQGGVSTMLIHTSCIFCFSELSDTETPVLTVILMLKKKTMPERSTPCQIDSHSSVFSGTFDLRCSPV